MLLANVQNYNEIYIAKPYFVHNYFYKITVIIRNEKYMYLLHASFGKLYSNFSNVYPKHQRSCTYHCNIF